MPDPEKREKRGLGSQFLCIEPNNDKNVLKMMKNHEVEGLTNEKIYTDPQEGGIEHEKNKYDEKFEEV